MKKTTKSAVISKHINSLLCYKTMASEACDNQEYTKATQAMQWFNEAADALIGMGIPVIKYNIEV